MDGYTMELFAKVRQDEALHEAATRHLLRAGRSATTETQHRWTFRLRLGALRRVVRPATAS